MSNLWTDWIQHFRSCRLFIFEFDCASKFLCFNSICGGTPSERLIFEFLSLISAIASGTGQSKRCDGISTNIIAINCGQIVSKWSITLVDNGTLSDSKWKRLKIGFEVKVDGLEWTRTFRTVSGKLLTQKVWNIPWVDDTWSSWDDIKVMIITNDSLSSGYKCVVKLSSCCSCKFHILASNVEIGFNTLIG